MEERDASGVLELLKDDDKESRENGMRVIAALEVLRVRGDREKKAF